MSTPFTLAIIALNEAANIERCIRSVPMADEVIVVDSGSEDGTAEIAVRLGAKVVQKEWLGFRAQKTFAASLARNSWILSLDADEALSPEAAEELKSWLKSPELQNIDGLEFPRRSFNLGRWIHHGGWFPDWQLRFYHRERGEWRAGHLHERVFAPKKVRTKGVIFHWPFADLSEQVATNNRYSGLGAQDLFERGKPFSVIKLLFKPWSKFMETYFLKRGFLDGLPGFIIAVGAAYSVFLKHAKLWELQRKKSSST